MHTLGDGNRGHRYQASLAPQCCVANIVRPKGGSGRVFSNLVLHVDSHCFIYVMSREPLFCVPLHSCCALALLNQNAVMTFTEICWYAGNVSVKFPHQCCCRTENSCVNIQVLWSIVTCCIYKSRYIYTNVFVHHKRSYSDINSYLWPATPFDLERHFSNRVFLSFCFPPSKHFFLFSLSSFFLVVTTTQKLFCIVLR